MSDRVDTPSFRRRVMPRNPPLRLTVALIAAALFALIPSNASFASATSTTTIERFAISSEAFVSCALGGVGESVVVSGEAIVVTHRTTDVSGGTHLVVHANYNGFHGAGLTSGTEYVGITAETTTAHNFDPFVAPPYRISEVQTVRFTGRGDAGDLTLTFRFNLVVDANGVLRVDTYLQDVKCV
jgi:hypothetical protein